jgi:glycosyltransferase involved in cell wall biosynthesis
MTTVPRPSFFDELQATEPRMRKHGLVSVVVPLFNKAPYIGRCLESIRAQTVQDFEVVVIDDGSTDGGGDVARSVGDSRFRVIAQPNRGEGAARNRGITEAAGELIAFLDADDEWDADFLDAVLKLRRRYPEAGIFATGYRRLYAGGAIMETSVSTLNGERTRLVRNYFAAAREGSLVTSSSAAVPKSVLQELGQFVEGEPIGADVDLWARICLRHPVACDARVLATYHSESDGRSFELWRTRPPYPPVVRTLRRILADCPPSDVARSEIVAYAEWRLMSYAYWLLDLNQRARLAEFLRQERFTMAPYRLEAAILRASLAVFPTRVVRALRRKPELLFRRLQAAVIGDDSSRRRYVLCRQVTQDSASTLA